MKSKFVPIAAIIAVVAFFVIVDYKELNSYDVFLSVQREGFINNSVSSIIALGTFPLPEVQPLYPPQLLETYSQTTKNVATGVHSFSDTNIHPFAIQVVNAEEAIKANEEALLLHSNEGGSTPTNKNVQFAEKPKTEESVPMAVPVLTQEEALKINKEAIRFQQKKRFAEGIQSFCQKIGLNNNRIHFIISLLPLFFIFDVFMFWNKKKQTKINMVSGHIPLSRRMRILFSVSLLAFGFFVFVPWSVYFGNSIQFPFIFQDFVNWNLRLLAFSIIGASIVLLLIPPFLSDYVIAVVAGLGLCIYVQSMFMNQHLGTMDGIEPIWSEHRIFGITNLIVWIAIALSPIVLRLFVPKYYSTIISTTTGIILLLEIIATASMVFSSSQDVWIRPIDSYYIDGSEQFKLSKDKNVVVFVMDNLASSYIEQCFDEYPETKDIVKDFTWYADARSNYHMTFPGLIHELTGLLLPAPVDTFYDLHKIMWNSPSANSFYKQLKNAGYDVKLFFNMGKFCIGPEEYYHEYFSNIEPRDITYIIDYRRIRSCLKQMSCYSCAPYFFKRHFFYAFDFFDNIVQTQIGDIRSKTIPRSISDYLRELQSSGISSDASKPVFSFHYTLGAHKPWIYDEECNRRRENFDNPVPTTRGNFYIISEFIRFLKEANIYDNTAIFLCSDHGGNSTGGGDGKYDMSFMLKPFNEKKTELSIDMTKVQSIDILPTLLYMACGEKADFNDFDGFAPNSVPLERVRKVYTFYYNTSLSPADPDLDKCYPGCRGLQEYIFNNLETFKLGEESESFVRRIPLINTENKD